MIAAVDSDTILGFVSLIAGVVSVVAGAYTTFGTRRAGREAERVAAEAKLIGDDSSLTSGMETAHFAQLLDVVGSEPIAVLERKPELVRQLIAAARAAREPRDL